MLLINEKSFCRSPNDLRLIYLWSSLVLHIWQVIYFYHQKPTCGVSGDGCLVLPAKALLNLLLFRSQTTSDLFTYGLHQQYMYGWLYSFIAKKQLVE